VARTLDVAAMATGPSKEMAEWTLRGPQPDVVFAWDGSAAAAAAAAADGDGFSGAR
jgi:hypothetical protein